MMFWSPTDEFFFSCAFVEPAFWGIPQRGL